MLSKDFGIMKRFSLIIAALVFSASLMAQPFPTTFKSVQITGSYKAVAKQLEAEGFKASYFGSDMFNGTINGKKVIVVLEMNKKIDQICSFKISDGDYDKYDADKISAIFNEIYDIFDKNPKYTSDRENKKAKGEASFGPTPMGVVYTAKFYQDGDPNRLVELTIGRIAGKYYKELRFKNCYNQGEF